MKVWFAMRDLIRRVFDANMALWRAGLVVLTWGNVSEVDREAGLVAIKPSGVPYNAMKVEDIVVLRLDNGEKVEGELRPSSDTPTHLHLYRAFPSIGGVTHTHSRHATAWAQAGRPIPCMGTTHADAFYGDVPCARGLSADEVGGAYEAETGKVIVEAFEGRDPSATPAVLVCHHGPFTFGKTAAQSVENAVILEEVAAIAALTHGIDPAAKVAPEYLMDKHYYRKHGKGAYYGQKIW